MFYRVKGGSAKVSVPVNRKSMGVSANHTEDARLVGRGARPAGALPLAQTGGALPRPQVTGQRAPPTHLLIYSAFSCFPHVLHLKQPRCQCFSRATRDWPFLISTPQPLQPGRKNGAQPSSLWVWARGAGWRPCTAGTSDTPGAVRAGLGTGQTEQSSRGRYTTASVSAYRAPTACSLGRAPGIPG